MAAWCKQDEVSFNKTGGGIFLTCSAPVPFSSRNFFFEFVMYLYCKAVENIRPLLLCLDYYGYYVTAVVNWRDKIC